MENHPWPGNVRQLRHAIERLVALHPGGPVGSTHLEHLRTAEDTPFPPAGLLKYEDERALFERSYLERLLDAAEGNVSEAARISGIARQNIYDRMKRWGLS